MPETTIAQMEPWYDERESAALVRYFQEGGWGTEFVQTREFESMIAKYTGARYCSVLPNGTISLSVALQAGGIGAGDEVIVPDYTMVATPNAAELIGARAVFVDIERETLCMDYEALRRAVSPKSKAIMLVSINGRYPNRLEEILQFCRDRGIFVVEDAAQSLGSFHEGRHVGTYGAVGSFSFSTPKIITTGQGGALVTNDEQLIRRIRLIKDFGRERGGIDHYLVKGWNYKFTDFQAVIGIEQMKKLEWRVGRKRVLHKLYLERLNRIPQLRMPTSAQEGYTPWFYEILVDDKAELMRHLGARGIGSRDFYPPLHAEPAYGYSDQNYPVTEEISRMGLWLPSSAKLKDEDVIRVCETIEDHYGR